MTDTRTHISNIIDNLQLVADLGCAVTSLFVRGSEGVRIKATERPSTVNTIAPLRRVSDSADEQDDREVYECLASGQKILGGYEKQRGRFRYMTYAYPVGRGTPYAVITRDIPVGLSRELGALEEMYVLLSGKLLDTICRGVLRDTVTYQPFSTTHASSDGLFCLDGSRGFSYAGPNCARILGSDCSVDADHMLALSPDYDKGITSVLTGLGCFAQDIEIDHSIYYVRALPLEPGALVLFDDVTEVRGRERDLRVKEATIREVHHRVKNNLQTIESLLRMQMRRTNSDEVRLACAEAVSRIGAMAVAHDMLSYSSDERIDVVPMTRTIAEQVRAGLVGDRSSLVLTVEGEAGCFDARGAMSLALAIAELVHNAIEHGLKGCAEGTVAIRYSCDKQELRVVVEDDGCGLPPDFSFEGRSSMGIMLVRTMVEDDLAGALRVVSSSFGKGSAFALEIPLPQA
jgi:two-component system, sensor histidine kinase PdtaS